MQLQCPWYLKKINSEKSPPFKLYTQQLYFTLLLFLVIINFISWYRLHFLFVLWCILFIISIIIIQLSIHNQLIFILQLQHRHIFQQFKKYTVLTSKSTCIKPQFGTDKNIVFIKSMMVIYLEYFRSTGWIMANF